MFLFFLVYKFPKFICIKNYKLLNFYFFVFLNKFTSFCYIYKFDLIIKILKKINYLYLYVNFFNIKFSSITLSFLKTWFNRVGFLIYKVIYNLSNLCVKVFGFNGEYNLNLINTKQNICFIIDGQFSHKVKYLFLPYSICFNSNLNTLNFYFNIFNFKKLNVQVKNIYLSYSYDYNLIGHIFCSVRKLYIPNIYNKKGLITFIDFNRLTKSKKVKKDLN